MSVKRYFDGWSLVEEEVPDEGRAGAVQARAQEPLDALAGVPPLSLPPGAPDDDLPPSADWSKPGDDRRWTGPDLPGVPGALPKGSAGRR